MYKMWIIILADNHYLKKTRFPQWCKMSDDIFSFVTYSNLYHKPCQIFRIILALMIRITLIYNTSTIWLPLYQSWYALVDKILNIADHFWNNLLYLLKIHTLKSLYWRLGVKIWHTMMVWGSLSHSSIQSNETSIWKLKEIK